MRYRDSFPFGFAQYSSEFNTLEGRETVTLKKYGPNQRDFIRKSQALNDAKRALAHCQPYILGYTIVGFTLFGGAKEIPGIFRAVVVTSLVVPAAAIAATIDVLKLPISLGQAAINGIKAGVIGAQNDVAIKKAPNELNKDLQTSLIYNLEFIFEKLIVLGIETAQTLENQIFKDGMDDILGLVLLRNAFLAEIKPNLGSKILLDDKTSINKDGCPESHKEFIAGINDLFERVSFIIKSYNIQQQSLKIVLLARWLPVIKFCLENKLTSISSDDASFIIKNINFEEHYSKDEVAYKIIKADFSQDECDELQEVLQSLRAIIKLGQVALNSMGSQALMSQRQKFEKEQGKTQRTSKPSSQELVHLIKENNSQVLDLSYLNLTSEDLPLIMSNIKDMDFKWLILTGNNLCGQGLEEINLSGTGITHISLANNGIKSEDLKYLRFQGSNVLSLNLSGNKISAINEDAFNIVGTNIVKLFLNDNSITDDELARFHLDRTNVTDLTLAGNYLSGNIYLADFCKSAKKLASLNLSFNNFKPDGLVYLRLWGTNVRELNLCAIGPRFELGKLTLIKTKLKKLDLSWNKISNIYQLNLRDSILTYLNLNNNYLNLSNEIELRNFGVALSESSVNTLRIGSNKLIERFLKLLLNDYARSLIVKLDVLNNFFNPNINPIRGELDRFTAKNQKNTEHISSYGLVKTWRSLRTTPQSFNGANALALLPPEPLSMILHEVSLPLQSKVDASLIGKVSHGKHFLTYMLETIKKQEERKTKEVNDSDNLYKLRVIDNYP